ncbi:MAG: four-carbon acid sugar kinase family protein, partial [Treponema sp.]|nr:four-carbon acid sugar kinase family protein [Treponema sp.]
MCTLLILADDLSGALDTAAGAAGRGIPVRVYSSPESAGAASEEGPGVLVINTATRHLCPARAREIIAGCLRRLPGVPFVYKKTDSALRGNIGAELEEILRRRGGPLPFVPAWPRMGRTTEGGRQFINGIPLDGTELARDALDPVRHSFIPEIIAGQSKLPVSLAAPPFSGTEAGTEKWPGIVIFDARTGDDLLASAAFLMEKGFLGASAGCAGFAEALMTVLPFPPEKAPVPARPFPRRPLLVVSGSRHTASVAQVRSALENGVPGAAAGGEQAASFREGIKSCAGFLADRGICITGTRLSMGMEGFGEEGDAEDAARSLAKSVKGIVEKTGPVHLAVFGGDTLL